MSLQNILETSLEDIPEGVAVGYVDLKTGTLLGIASIEERPQEILNIMAAAIAELFEAPIFKTLDKIWSLDFSQESVQEDIASEILFLGSEYTTLLKRCENNTNHGMIYVARKSAPPGILLMRSRTDLPSIEMAANE